MSKRKLPIAIAVLLVAAAIALAIFVRRHAPPEPARLLPEADAYFYVNLTLPRAAGVFSKLPAVKHEPEYDDFVKQTGFQVERDLDEAAFAVHGAPVNPASPNNAYPWYSEVLIANFDSSRVSGYLQKLSRTSELYRNIEIYNIPHEDRIVRVALLGVHTVAVSNVDSPDAIHYIIDRHKELAFPFRGPALLREFYKRVPLASIAWAIARMPSGSQKKTIGLPVGFETFFPAGTVLVSSLRYLGSVDLRIEADAASEADARHISDQLGAFASIFRGMEGSMKLGGTDQDVKALFDSIKVEQEKDRVVFSAHIPVGFLKKIATEPPTEQITGPTSPPVPEKKPGRKKKR